jgi:hypothetical protein
VHLHAGSTVLLCLNATATLTTAVACQFVGKTLTILAAWVREGDPGAVVAEIVRDAGLSIGTELRLIAPPSHFRPYDTIGLPGAVRRLPAELHRGGDVTRGRAALRALLQQQTQGRPALQVSAQASWAVNGFAAGYARAMDARAARNASGVPVAEEASDGVYRVLFEGLESAMALGLPTTRDEDERNRRYAIAADGRQYLTTAPSLAQLATTATKDEWWRDGPEMPRTIRHRPLPR